MRKLCKIGVASLLTACMCIMSVPVMPGTVITADDASAVLLFAAAQGLTEERLTLADFVMKN